MYHKIVKKSKLPKHYFNSKLRKILFGNYIIIINVNSSRKKIQKKSIISEFFFVFFGMFIIFS